MVRELGGLERWKLVTRHGQRSQPPEARDDAPLLLLTPAGQPICHRILTPGNPLDHRAARNPQQQVGGQRLHPLTEGRPSLRFRCQHRHYTR